jgi:hypothetical protein
MLSWIASFFIERIARNMPQPLEINFIFNFRTLKEKTTTQLFRQRNIWEHAGNTTFHYVSTAMTTEKPPNQ